MPIIGSLGAPPTPVMPQKVPPKGPYCEYFEYIINEKRKQNKHQIPVAGPDPTDSKVVTFAAPTGLRIVRWVTAARGTWPDLPAVASLSGNYVFLDSELWIHSPKPSVNQAYLYIVYGEYLYAMVKARPVDSSVAVGGLPATYDTFTGDDTISKTSFKQFLTNRQPF